MLKHRIFRDDDISVATKMKQFEAVDSLFIKYGVTHTIAVIAKDIEKNTELVEYIKSHPHIDVQLHCWEHIDLNEDIEIAGEHMTRAIAYLFEVFGQRVNTWFPPWNKVSPELSKIAENLGLEVSTQKLSLSQYNRVGEGAEESVINFHYWAHEDIIFLETALRLYTTGGMPRVALVTANIGDFDTIVPPVEQTVPYDYYCFTEENLPFPLPNLNNRLKGKYIKTKMHKFLSDYDLFIWMDGRVQVTDSKFIEHMIEQAKDHDVAIPLHPDRNNIYEEIEFIKGEMLNGDKYLLDRYENEPFYAEYDFYKKNNIPQTLPLFACTIFARWNNRKLNEAFNDWWDGCIEFTNFDQTYFAYTAWLHDLKIRRLSFESDYYLIGKHK